MLNLEKIKSDLECLKRARMRLEANHAGDIALAVVDGIIEGDQFALDALYEAHKETHDQTPNKYNRDLLKQAALTGANQ